MVRSSGQDGEHRQPPQGGGGRNGPGTSRGNHYCNHHCVTDEYYLPQLRRLLAGADRDRLVYDGIVADVVGSANPLDLFKRSQLRRGVYLIEALYRTLTEQAEHGDELALPSLAPLGYSRWVAWRRFGDAVRSRSVSFGSSVGQFISLSRHDVVHHVHAGWRPAVIPPDPELIELLHNR